jgi:hypothetical protein
MVISPDEVLVWQLGPVAINATIVFTWLVMALVVIGSWLVTRRLTAEAHISRGQNILEAVVILLRDQIREVSQQQPDPLSQLRGHAVYFYRHIQSAQHRAGLPLAYRIAVDDNGAGDLCVCRRAHLRHRPGRV